MKLVDRLFAKNMSASNLLIKCTWASRLAKNIMARY